MSAAIDKVLREHAFVEGAPRVGYGTAGFRSLGPRIIPIAARMGFLLAARAAVKKHELGSSSGTAPVLGAMITASHNAAPDNGLKLVDFNAGMLSVSWEPLAEQLSTATTAEDIQKFHAAVRALHSLPEDFDLSGAGCRVVIGRDTRETSPAVLAALTASLEAAGAVAVDIGIVTTPMLHWVVEKSNDTTHHNYLKGGAETPADSYIGTIAVNTVGLWSTLSRQGLDIAEQTIIVDCANGVGSVAFKQLAEKLKAVSAAMPGTILPTFHLVNTDTENKSKLNFECGADLAQKEQRPSKALIEAAIEFAHTQHKTNIACYTVDGDADRVVAFAFWFDRMPTADGAPPDAVEVADGVRAKLLDGDRITVLLSMGLKGLFASSRCFSSKQPEIKVVQTAYANGGSTRFMQGEKINLPVTMAATGVKHVHHVAAAAEVGVYFEANGHGTALFSPPVLNTIRTTKVSGQASDKEMQLAMLSELLSQCCGDAVGNVLAIEFVRALTGVSFANWCAIYEDLPSAQIKVTVPNPKRVKTTPDETKATGPEGLQAAIDEVVARIGGNARSFVRPSGTEPIVRVYAEADTADATKELGKEVCALVEKFLAEE